MLWRLVAPRSSSGNQSLPPIIKTAALVAQLDRAPDFESGGRGFESLRARQHLESKLHALKNSAPGSTPGKPNGIKSLIHCSSARAGLRVWDTEAIHVTRGALRGDAAQQDGN